MTKEKIEEEIAYALTHSEQGSYDLNMEYIKGRLDEVYSIGFRNGRIDMKNKILKVINRDWGLIGGVKYFALLVKLLKKINRLK